MIEAIYSFDYALLSLIATMRTDGLTVLFKAITTLGDHGLLWLLLLAFFVLIRRELLTSMSLTLALGSSAVLTNYVIKLLILRPRPFVAYLELIALIVPSDEWSFPSAHTATSFAAATAIFCYHKKTGAICYIAAALIAFSRLYLGVHYPSDVLAGTLLGILCGMLSYKLTDPLLHAAKRFVKKGGKP